MAGVVHPTRDLGVRLVRREAPEGLQELRQGLSYGDHSDCCVETHGEDRGVLSV